MRKRFLFLAISLLLILVLPLLLLEGGGRLYISMKYGVPGKSYGLWRADEILSAIHRENAYNTKTQTNDFGFRNQEDVLAPKPEGSVRVITYGGSTTFCYNLADNDAWPHQLEKQLRQGHNKDDQVLNGGAILWSLSHAYARARQDLPTLLPNYVIIYSGINDETNAFHLKLEGTPLKELLESGKHGVFAKNFEQNRWLKRNSIIVRFIDYFIKNRIKFKKNTAELTDTVTLDLDNSVESDPIVFENYALVLRDFIELIKANGGVPIFVIQTHGRNSQQNVKRTSYSRRGAATAQKLGAIVVDADEIVRNFGGDPMDLFYETGVHLSKEGSFRLAEHIYDIVFRGLSNGRKEK